jgi:hypothetical protein
MRRLRKTWLIIAAAGLLLTGCFGQKNASIVPAKANPAVLQEAEPWLADLELLIDTLVKKHKNVYHSHTKEEFDKLADTIRKEFPGWNEQEKRVGMMRLAAYVGDAHTTLRPNKLEHLLPLYLYLFPEGMFVRAAEESYSGLLGMKVTAINGLPVDDVIVKLSDVIPHENKMWLSYLLPQPVFMQNGDLLYGLGITDKPEEALFSFEDGSGRKTEQLIHFLPPRPEQQPVIKQLGPSRESGPLYMKQAHEQNWFDWNADSGMMYIQYNRCSNQQQQQTVKEYGEEILSLLKDSRPRKVIIDLRFNSGGNSELFKPFITEMSRLEHINRKGVTYVIIGRGTYSSGLLTALTLKEKTKAVLVGEPTGGKPNGYGEVKQLKLPVSGMTLGYSIKYFKTVSDDRQLSLVPDVVAALTSRDWIEGRDPAVEYIMAQP